MAVSSGCPLLGGAQQVGGGGTDLCALLVWLPESQSGWPQHVSSIQVRERRAAGQGSLPEQRSQRPEEATDPHIPLDRVCIRDEWSRLGGAQPGS